MDTAFFTLSLPGAGGTRCQLQEGAGLGPFLIVYDGIFFL